MGKGIHYKSLSWEILKIVGGGVVVASMLVAPNMGLLLGPLLAKSSARERRELARAQIRRAVQRLRNRRYVRFEQKGNETYIKITEHGRERLRRFEFDALRLPEQARRWDKKWRLVIFDIPEHKKRERNIFSGKLKDLGLFALQKSVFVYPYDCEDEIDFLASFLDVDYHVHFLEAVSLGGGEVAARRYFGLL